MLVRELDASDSLEQLTELLHLSYARLADMGFRFVATHQNVETTRDRVSSGSCFVAEIEGQLVGTVTWYRPTGDSLCAVYNQPGVAVFGQFAVDPERQGHGIGRALLTRVEADAKEAGFETLALDTSEGASHLIDMYRRWGFEVVGHVNWPVTNYRSAVMAKSLEDA